MSTNVALIVASGRGVRFGGDRPKQYQPLLGRPVLRHAMEPFLAHPAIDRVRVVIHPDDAGQYREAASGLDLLPPVAGGASRQESAWLGLESLGAAPPERVLIHDGVRPLPGAALIGRVLGALERAPAVVPTLPVTDTLKRARDGQVEATVERAGLFRAQTPQGFHFAAILDAHRQSRGQALTDDAAVAAAAGLPVVMVEGEEDNLKVTEAADLDRARRLLAGAARSRTGLGFDVHRLVPGDPLILLGVRIPCGLRLTGHSDADVGLHALTDALLGAIGAGDIGSHFPPTDARWRGADSARFLEHARDLIGARGGWIEHVDVTLVCEAPRIGPHREAMVERLSGLLRLGPDQVSVKATTTERLGFTGRGEGIAAQAIATVGLAA